MVNVALDWFDWDHPCADMISTFRVCNIAGLPSNANPMLIKGIGVLTNVSERGDVWASRTSLKSWFKAKGHGFSPETAFEHAVRALFRPYIKHR
jgi:hypothetical protein